MKYRNIWVVNTRNFGDSDHHDSLEMEEVCNDVARFMEEKNMRYAYLKLLIRTNDVRIAILTTP